jgi:hypothetical protein
MACPICLSIRLRPRIVNGDLSIDHDEAANTPNRMKRPAKSLAKTIGATAEGSRWSPVAIALR